MKSLKRRAYIRRKTKETDIKIDLNIDGKGQTDILTPIPFLNHLLDNFGKHGLFNLTGMGVPMVSTGVSSTRESVLNPCSLVRI